MWSLTCCFVCRALLAAGPDALSRVYDIGEGDHAGKIQLIRLPKHRLPGGGESLAANSCGIIFLGHGSDHTLNMDPCFPSHLHVGGNPPSTTSSTRRLH